MRNAGILLAIGLGAVAVGLAMGGKEKSPEAGAAPNPSNPDENPGENPAETLGAEGTIIDTRSPGIGMPGFGLGYVPPDAYSAALRLMPELADLRGMMHPGLSPSPPWAGEKT